MLQKESESCFVLTS